MFNFQNNLQESIKRSNAEDDMAWNNIQRQLMCCGVDSPADWRGQANKSLPGSCCRPEFIDEKTAHCTDSPALGRDKYYQVGFLIAEIVCFSFFPKQLKIYQSSIRYSYNITNDIRIYP